MARDWGQYVDTVMRDRAGKDVNSKNFGVCMMSLIYCVMTCVKRINSYKLEGNDRTCCVTIVVGFSAIILIFNPTYAL